MKLVSRVELGWSPKSPAADMPEALGVKIHYEGTLVPKVDHAECAERWKRIRANHLANEKENYVDVAYNLAVCQHGHVFEGRGAGKRPGANGSFGLNSSHYAVLVMIGSEGETEPTPEAVGATREVIHYLRQRGAEKEILGHRDGYATACPGDALYALVKSGELEPLPPPKPRPVYAPFPGASFFKIGKKHDLFTAMGKRLVAEGYTGYKTGPSPTFTTADKTAYRWWQRRLGYTGSAADGIPGEASWKRLKVPKS